MGIYLSVMQTRYEDDEPLYLTTEDGELVFDRVRGRWLDWDSLETKAVADSHTWQSREVGIPSIMWQLANSLATGQRWAPGLDSTDGLASEAVTNGDEFTGASSGGPGDTPPTGWTSDGNASFQLFPSVLNIHPDPILGGGMTQDLTLTPGTAYVCEVLLAEDTIGGRVSIGDSTDTYYLPLKGATDNTGSEVNAFSFVATEATMTIGFSVAPGDLISVDHIRVFEEAELTGSGDAGGGGGPGPIDPPDFQVLGPYVVGETTFFIQKFEESGIECKVWLDADSDPDPDVALTKQEVCESNLNDQAKMAIDAQLQADGCGGLPCMTAAGKVQKKYSKDDG